jgi:hypothetical protein
MPPPYAALYAAALERHHVDSRHLATLMIVVSREYAAHIVPDMNARAPSVRHNETRTSAAILVAQRRRCCHAATPCRATPLPAAAEERSVDPRYEPRQQ